MPVYNGALFISKAIESIRNQSFTDWILQISDNASEDATSEICKKFIKIDPRIQYIRQIKNIGATENFQFLLFQAKAEFFMWAAADDIWDASFIETCVSMLDDNKAIGLAFCNIVNIDSSERVIRQYPSFKGFSGRPTIKSVYKYLISPEILGKANLIYGIYRLQICKNTWEMFPLSEDWGSDMCFVLGAIARGGVLIDDRVLFYKRIQSENDEIDQLKNIIIKKPKNHIFPFLKSFSYLKNNIRTIKGTDYYWITFLIISFRIPRSFVIFIYENLFTFKKKIFHKFLTIFE